MILFDIMNGMPTKRDRIQVIDRSGAVDGSVSNAGSLWGMKNSCPITICIRSHGKITVETLVANGWNEGKRASQAASWKYESCPGWHSPRGTSRVTLVLSFYAKLLC